jgi:hypothetical protein
MGPGSLDEQAIVGVKSLWIHIGLYTLLVCRGRSGIGLAAQERQTASFSGDFRLIYLGRAEVSCSVALLQRRHKA